MKNTLKKFLLGLAIFVSLQSVFAGDSPDRTYIWKYGDPSFFFNYGMTAYGTDYNLLDLISGDETSINTTGYIFTVSNHARAMLTIQERLQNRTGNQPNEYWIYSIRPSLNFYDVVDSLHSSAQQARRDQNYDLVNRLETTEEMMRSTHFNMLAVRNAIEPTQIESATLYRLVNNELVAIETRENQNYIPQTPTINPDDILITGSTDQYIFYSSLGTFHILPGAFCESFFAGAKRGQSNTEADACTEHTYNDLALKLRRDYILVSA